MDDRLIERLERWGETQRAEAMQNASGRRTMMDTRRRTHRRRLATLRVVTAAVLIPLLAAASLMWRGGATGTATEGPTLARPSDTLVLDGPPTVFALMRANREASIDNLRLPDAGMGPFDEQDVIRAAPGL